MNKAFNILVVDDNPRNLKIVSGFLENKGYNIALAANGMSALEILNENNIDLILLDVTMSDMNGFEVCEKIKEKKELQEIPIIFLTAKNDTNDIIKGFEIGGVDYISKPFIPDELLIRVKTHLDLSQAKKKLLDTIKTRDKLYSIIAHDIRGPFGNISMLLGLIADGTIDTSGPEFKDIILKLEKSTRDTYTLFSNLLEWTKLQVGAISLKPQNIPISLVINDCIQLLSGNAHNKNIILESHITNNPIAFFDEVTMYTVFRNLISNAIKFTPENGKIEIDSEISENYISVFIKDTGVGIPNMVLEKIFKNKENYTSRGTQNEQGSGLGLHIVKDLVEQNKGTVAVTSVEGKGTAFTINIPTASE